jgi:phage gp29-like protein
MAAAKKKTAKAPRLSKAYVEPSTRIFTEWTPARIRSAEISADSGEMRQAADLCEGLLLTDDRVVSALWTRVQALLGLEPTFEASGDKRRRSRPVKALDAGEDWWAAYPESDLALLHMWGLLLGIAPAQQPWAANESHGGRWLANLEFWHPRGLRQDQRDKSWWIKVAPGGNALAGSQEIQIVLGSPEWVLHTPYGRNRPHAWGLWRPLSRMVLTKHLASSDWSRAGEKGAILAIEIALEAAGSFSSDRGNPHDAMRQLATDVYNRGRNAVAALPPGASLKAVDVVTKAKELYESPIQLINEAIAILIRGANLGTLTTGGSRAAAEVQERTADLPRLRFDAQTLTTTLHDQSLVHWAEFNYGDRALAPWPVYPVEPAEDRASKGETEERALGNLDAAEKLGLEVDRQEFLDQYGIEWAKPGERPATEPPPVESEPEDEAEPDPDAEDAPEADPEPAERSLASRASNRENQGFIDGQLYADALAESATEHGAEALQPDVRTVLEIVEASSDYDELRTRLRKAFRGMSPDRFSAIVEKALILGELAGRASVLQDV